MQGLRWTGSDRVLMDAAEVEQLSAEVAAEITDEQYDGYKARNQVLAAMIAFHLCSLTESEGWHVYADETQDEDGKLYRVWVNG